MDEKHAIQIRHNNSKSGGFGTRHFFSGGFCRKVADSETATFLVADFISVQYVLGSTYNGHIPSGWSRIFEFATSTSHDGGQGYSASLGYK
jgi:hypothetical protein